jgi:1-acyl-sn-glycerol-3-phosphate acyltransferase
VFCADLTAGKGIPALKAAVKILLSGEMLLLFPEGWTNMDGMVGPFKRGVVSIARMTEAKGGRPVSIIPVYMRYGKYPGAWIRRFPMPVQCLIMLFGLISFRRGVRVVVGAPLLSSELSRDPTQATEHLRDAVLMLKANAEAIPAGAHAGYVRKMLD